ncbi:hypothetical protein PRI8871_00273 [Pseudoprimorskyibacter insulae]|uniref:Major facilitator superfamily (MFS) profile domain-containing protein n=2 Tax=Pseudoprimorskyibacter insulae TaxID=1695997 RepID=A0A2R8AP92_9RHOB|nr:hypothetical protein PRI8871_00273 [Pseudoprimorskyibacter insulae]
MRRMTQPPDKLPISALIALYFAGLCAATQFAKVSVPFEALRDAYPEAGAELGFLVSIISFLGVVLGLFAGIVVSRVGFRRLLIAALLFGAILSGAESLLPPFPVMLALRLLEGASHLVIVVAAPTLMAVISPAQYRPAVMTVWSTFFGAGFFLMAWLGTPLVASHGLPVLLHLHGLAMIVVAGALWHVLPRGAVPVSDERLSLRMVLHRHRAAYRSPSVAAPAMGWLCYTLTYVALLTVLPGQLSEADRAWAATLMPVAGMVVSMTLGMVLLVRIRAVSLVTTGFLLAAGMTLVLMAQSSSAWLAIGLMAMLGLVQSSSFAAIPQLNPDPNDQALANGAMAQMGNLGNTLGTPLLLVLLEVGGVPAIYLGLCLCYVLGAGLHLAQARRRQRLA